MSHDDAAALEAAEGTICRVMTELEEGWFDAVLPVVEISGSTEPDDSCCCMGITTVGRSGVGDNATGDAAMLEIARVLWHHRAALRRSVRMAWWPGHSTGKFAGSTWYCDEFAHELMAGCVAHLNCDSPGVRGAVAYDNIPAMAETFDVVKRAVHDVTGVAATCKRPSQSSDYSFNNIGISGLFSSSSRLPKAELAARGYYYVMGNGGDTSWHTERDTLDVADRAVLLADIKVYLLAVLRSATRRCCRWTGGCWRPSSARRSRPISRRPARASISPRRPARQRRCPSSWTGSTRRWVKACRPRRRTRSCSGSPACWCR